MRSTHSSIGPGAKPSNMCFSYHFFDTPPTTSTNIESLYHRSTRTYCIVAQRRAHRVSLTGLTCSRLMLHCTSTVTQALTECLTACRLSDCPSRLHVLKYQQYQASQLVMWLLPATLSRTSSVWPHESFRVKVRQSRGRGIEKAPGKSIGQETVAHCSTRCGLTNLPPQSSASTVFKKLCHIENQHVVTQRRNPPAAP